MTETLGEITRLLRAWSEGDEGARDQVIPLVFDELRKIARHQFQLEKPGHTLEPTAVVNELYVKLASQRNVQFQNRREFFAISAELIRRILVDHARRRRAQKRGSGEPRISIQEELGLDIAIEKDPDLIALDDALKDLAALEPRGSRIVELDVFGGLTFDEVADHLAVSRATVMRDWKHAKLWLKRQVHRS